MRWIFIISAFIGLTSLNCCAGAPTGSDIKLDNFHSESGAPDPDTTTTPSSTSSSSLSSARKLPAHDVGLPSELAWQAWLVVANQPDAESSFESATVPRRISPKSVFVAPALHACPDGYKTDSAGICVKETIQINYKTHLEFILERLRSKFPSTVQLDDSAAMGPDLKESAASGPLQVNISLGIEDNLSASRSPSSTGNSEREREADGSVEISVVQVPQPDASRFDRKPVVKTDAGLIATYEVANGTDNAEVKKATFFRGNYSDPMEDDSIRDIVVPVAEFVDDGNQTFTEVIDYQIPIALGQLINDSDSKLLAKNFTKIKNTDIIQQPTVVLLLSPTKLAGTPSTPYIKESDSQLEISKNRINSTAEDEIKVNYTEVNSSSENVTAGEHEAVTSTDDGLEDTTLSEVGGNSETTTYPEEDYDVDEATDVNDEILTHGEAGMLVSVAGKLSTSINPEDSERPLSYPGGVASTSSTKTADEIGGNISSESSISGDVIVETTLLDLNTGTSRPALPVEKLDDLRELFEAEEDVDLKPEVIFSPHQDALRLERLSTRGKNRPEDFTIPSSSGTVKPSSSSVVNLDDFTAATSDPSPEETVQHASRYEEHVAVSDGDYSHRELSHLQQRRRTANSGQEYVRFPEDQRIHSSSSHVRFPSDHSNSINANLNYKEGVSSHRDDNTRSQLMPKSNVPPSQKKTYWHLPPGLRIDDIQATHPRQQQVAIQNGNNNNNKRQNPMLFRFWTRMPLFRDPSLSDASNQSLRSISPPIVINQRENIYKAILPQHQHHQTVYNPTFNKNLRDGQRITIG